MLSVLLAGAVAIAPVPAMTDDWWSDYYDTPGRGLAPGEASLVVAEITVDKRGHFAGCIGHAYMGNPQMGPYVCSRLKMRADFEPARGPDGQRIVGIYRKLIVVVNAHEMVTFRAPKFGIHIPASGGTPSDNPFEIQFYLGADGQVSDCTLIDSIGLHLEKHKQVVDADTVGRACAQVSAQLEPAPPQDERGNPIATVQNALATVDSRPAESHNQ